VPTVRDGDSLSMLLPVRYARAGIVNDHRGWIEVGDMAELTVDVAKQP